MVGLSKATLLALGLSSLIILTSFVWTQAAGIPGVTSKTVKIMSNNDMQALLAAAKGKTLIQVQNKAGTIIEVECLIGPKLSLGKQRIDNLEALAFYFSPKEILGFRCNVSWKTTNRLTMEVYNQAGLLNNMNVFEITKDGASRNGRKVTGWN